MSKPINPCVINNGGSADEDIHLRDLFAAAALAGLLANPSYDHLEPDEWASDAGNLADAMLAERAKS